MKENNIKIAIKMLKNLLSWSDRIGSDEIHEIRLIINKLKRSIENAK